MAGAFAVAALLISRPDPSRIIQEAQKKLVHEPYFRTEIDFSINGVFNRPELSFGDSRIELQGHTRTDADRTTPEAVKTVSNFDISLTSGEETLTVKGEARRADYLHYLRLDEISDAIFPGIKEVEGEWMRSPDSFLSFLIQPLEKDLVLNDLTADEFKEMHEILSVVPLFEYKDTLPTETIDNEKTYHYSIGIRQEAIAAVMTRLRELRTGLESRPEDYALELVKVLSWGDATGEVWIGKNDWKIRKISLSSLLSEPTGGARFETQVYFSRFGIPVEVEVPNAKDVEDVLGRVFSGHLFLSGDRTIKLGEQLTKDELKNETPNEVKTPETSDATAPQDGSDGTSDSSKDKDKTTPADVDTDGDGLSDSDEFVFGSDPWNPDTDGDGWSDGVEVANGKNPVGPGALFGFGL